jgi:L-threonylcarbamoyladenylate synthase
MPTETVYGLAADAANTDAVASIFLAKGRPRFNPLIVHVRDLATAESIALFSGTAFRLAEAFWPGPLTLVLPRRAEAAVADLVTAGLETIALRVPAHPVAQELLATTALALAAPSANRSGHVSPTTAAHVDADLGDRVAVILDGGPTTIGLESTIVGFDPGRAFLLRSGGLDRAAIEEIVGDPLITPQMEPDVPLAPGMLASHYAPAATLRLDVTDVRPGEALIAFGRDLPPGARKAVAVQNLSKSGDTVEAAGKLFAALRTLDEQSGTIAVMPIPESGLGEAINDRLRRAAAPRS